ncbi:MAG: 2,3-bisphosphoglycerate-independent phosphoglycerate mutase [Candidatus Paceibacterota bacterium]
MKKQVALIVLDGWGYREEAADNAVAAAKTPNFDKYWNMYPHTLLEASGEAVGLPEGQVGNSEIGHMTIGAGRSLDTDLVRIGKTIREDTYGERTAFGELFAHVQEHDSAIHILGLLGTGGVHAHHDHLVAFLKACKKQGITKVYLHVFTDGRDTAPQSAGGFLKTLEHELQTIGVGRIATMSGRFYAMDRDQNWDRLAHAEAALFEGTGTKHYLKPSEIMEALHKEGVYDERMEPVVITDADGTAYPIQKNDGIFFFNFRSDRARMLTETLLKHKEDKNLFIVTMTEYSSKYDVVVAFPPEALQTTLAQEVSQAGMTQAHVAETEKFPHATYFLNGGKEEPHTGEEHVLLNSRKDVPTHDLAPKMRAESIADETIKRIQEDVNFIFVNIANPDMVGHTANVPAIVEALEETDTQLGRIINAITANGGTAIITADHGNAEVNFDQIEGVPHTAHTLNKVPCIITDASLSLKDGGDLTWLAPTVLGLLAIQKPAGMTGKEIFGV